MAFYVYYLGGVNTTQPAARFFLSDTAAEFPTTGHGIAEGDFGYAKNTDKLYTWDGSSWTVSSGLASPVAIADGGTGQTTQTSAFDALAPTTTKGDLIAHDGTDNVRLVVGTDEYTLYAESSATEGVKWDLPTGNTILTWGSSIGSVAASMRRNGDIADASPGVDAIAARIQITQAGTLKNF